MSIKSREDSLPLVKKEWLYPEESFIHYCNLDAYSNGKLPRQINADFLRALEKDGFIKPLLVTRAENIVRQEANKPREILEYEKTPTNYYSPFQIFVVALFATNEIDGNGLLRKSEEIEWQKSHNVRTVATGWDGGGFNIMGSDMNKAGGKWWGPILGLSLVPEDLHNFLRLLCGFGEVRDLGSARADRQRYFSRDPSLQYDLRPLESEGKQLLSRLGLSEARLVTLRQSVGQFATDIDPLENWYYYLEKHPQWRKDRLKGPAVLAQELYRLCDLIVEVLEKVTGKPQKPLLEFLHPDFEPMDVAGIEYLRGQDTRAVGSAFGKLKGWLSDKENKDLAEQAVSNLPEDRRHELLDSPNVSQAIGEVEKDLMDFDNRYKERYYQDGVMRKVEGEEQLTLEDLDSETRKLVESMMASYKNIREGRNGKSWLVLSNTDIMEKHNRKDGISEEEAIRLDRERVQKEEIAVAIEHRLRSIQVHLQRIIFAISEGLRYEKEKAQEELKVAEADLWKNFRATAPKQYEKLEDGRSAATGAYVVAYSKFLAGDFKEGKQPYQDKINKINEKESELDQINWFAGLVLCAVCRKEPVQLHYGFGDRQVSFNQICDKCFARIDSELLSLDEEGWKNLKEGEWRCDCGRVLYKFAHRNTISLWAVGKQPIKVGLNYGKAALEAKCNGCGKVSRREIDWGWTP